MNIFLAYVEVLFRQLGGYIPLNKGRDGRQDNGKKRKKDEQPHCEQSGNQLTNENRRQEPTAGVARKERRRKNDFKPCLSWSSGKGTIASTYKFEFFMLTSSHLFRGMTPSRQWLSVEEKEALP